jgi:hypothetical protein
MDLPGLIPAVVRRLAGVLAAQKSTGGGTGADGREVEEVMGALVAHLRERAETREALGLVEVEPGSVNAQGVLSARLAEAVERDAVLGVLVRQAASTLATDVNQASNFGSGSIAATGGMAVGEGGVAVGGGVQGDVNVGNTTYHVSGNLTVIQQVATTLEAARTTLRQGASQPPDAFWDDHRRQRLAAKQQELTLLMNRLAFFEHQAANKDPNNLDWSLVTNLQSSAEAVEKVRLEVERLSQPSA